VFVPPQTTEAPRVEEPTFPGTLVLPPNVERAPAVILLHGSEGGAGGLLRIAREWTQRGFIALALCYYGCEGTPTTLNDVPVETVGRAVEYLRGRDDVDPDAIGVVGYSRGAEFALIAGVLDDRIGAVASIMGSYLVVPGYPNGGIAWTYEGKPLPWEVIPVERINGPVLVVHGERDDVWPVANSYHLADRLARHDRPYELVVYPSAGHSFNLSADATERAIAFMQQAFGR
jgi:dienelactone hydrolase